jgi:hypothetical protein
MTARAADTAATLPSAPEQDAGDGIYRLAMTLFARMLSLCEMGKKKKAAAVMSAMFISTVLYFKKREMFMSIFKSFHRSREQSCASAESAHGQGAP